MQKINATFVDPPIPTGFEWVASYDGDEPDDDGRMATGHGSTEQAAIDNLCEAHPRDTPEEMARADARMGGIGFTRIHSDGTVERLPPEQVMIFTRPNTQEA